MLRTSTIKQFIRSGKYTAHQITELVFLERFIFSEPTQMFPGMHFSHLKTTYSAEYYAILQEVDSKRLQQELAEKDRLKRESIEISKDSEIKEQEYVAEIMRLAYS